MNFFSMYYENVISNVDWVQALLIFVLGVATVFAVLAVLWGILACMKLVFAKADKPSEAAVSKAETSASAKAECKMTPPVKVATSAPENKDELVAIFTAAVNAIDGSTNLRVKSYKKL